MQNGYQIEPQPAQVLARFDQKADAARQEGKRGQRRCRQTVQHNGQQMPVSVAERQNPVGPDQHRRFADRRGEQCRPRLFVAQERRAKLFLRLAMEARPIGMF